MDFLESLKRGLAGEQIKRRSGEWIIVCSSGSQLRFVANRQIYHPTVSDMLSVDWLSENDFLKVSNLQLITALKNLGIEEDSKVKGFLRELGFK